MSFNMTKEQAIQYVKENYHNGELYIGAIEDYIFEGAFDHYDLFAHEERGGGPFYGEIKDREFYIFGYDHGFNLAGLEKQGFDMKVEGAMFHLILSKMNELIQSISEEDVQ